MTTPLSSLPLEARRRFAEIGPRWGDDIGAHRDFVISTYSPIVSAASRQGIDERRDISYGSDPRQVLDACMPRGVRNADVVLFVHGGAFLRGKKSMDGAIYDNVCRWFARHDRLAFNVEYRLAPAAVYPSGAEDVGRAVQWVSAHAESLGGNPHRLFLVGHSAGATHVATYAFDPSSPIDRHPSVAGVVLLSGRLRADVRSTNPNANGVRAYFGDDDSLYEARSPMAHAARVDIPLFVAVAEFENPHLDEYGREFVERVRIATGRAPRFRQLDEHNHTSIVAHFDSGEDSLGLDILDFMAHAT
jgi:acetyl esterase/lipase